MSRPEVGNRTSYGLKTVLAFILGAGIGLALVAPVLPEDLLSALVIEVPQGGDVILVGVLALSLLTLLVAVFYKWYLMT